MFTASAKANAVGINAFGMSMSASASATATGTSKADAQFKATQTAQKVADTELNTTISNSNQLVGTTLSLIGTSENIGKYWVQVKGAPVSSWKSVSSSASGQYQVAADFNYIYLSADYGQTWAKSTILGQLDAVSMSASGKYITAVQFEGNVYTSDDFGNTFIQVVVADITTGQYWGMVSISASGQYQTIGIIRVPEYLYRSEDFGKTWTRITNLPVGGDWSTVAVSSSGQYQTGGKYRADDNGAPLYVSSDYGVNWIGVGNKIITWVGMSISASGQYQLVGGDGTLFISNNFGASFLPIESAGVRNWYSTSISASGKYQVAVVNNGYIYMSYNYGETWSQVTDIDGIPGSRAWTSVTMSASGQYITALTDGGYIYTSAINRCCNK